nr:glycosyltransferase family 39 protein [Deltaproteobacteria bacterium]
MNQDRLHRRYISEYTAGKLKSVHPIYRYIVVGIFGLVLFFLNLGEWDLWNPDEPRYAQIAREMRESGEWILPHLNGMVYAEKPPLVFWLTALSQKIFNKDSAFSNRFPSAVAALLTTLVVYWFGTRLFNERAGIFAALVLATNAEFFWLAHRVNLDTMLTLWITAAMAAMYTGLVDSR